MKAFGGFTALLPLAAFGMTIASLSFASPAQAQAANAATGKRLYARCQACHSTVAGQPHKVGPNLSGFYGQKAASRPGFRYSRAMAASPVKWDDKTLDAWLQRPNAVVPGTTMAFPGMARPEDRVALIAYLKTLK